MIRFALLIACGLGVGAASASAQTGGVLDRPAGSDTAPGPTAPGPTALGPTALGPTAPGLGGRQFPSGAVEQRVRGADDPATAERDRRPLQDLNELSRQLTPPGTPVPAPEADRRRP